MRLLLRSYQPWYILVRKHHASVHTHGIGTCFEYWILPNIVFNLYNILIVHCYWSNENITSSIALLRIPVPITTKTKVLIACKHIISMHIAALVYSKRWSCGLPNLLVTLLIDHNFTLLSLCHLPCIQNFNSWFTYLYLFLLFNYLTCHFYFGNAA